jgi:hypothetical protein
MIAENCLGGDHFLLDSGCARNPRRRESALPPGYIEPEHREVFSRFKKTQRTIKPVRVWSMKLRVNGDLWNSTAAAFFQETADQRSSDALVLMLRVDGQSADMHSLRGRSRHEVAGQAPFPMEAGRPNGSSPGLPQGITIHLPGRCKRGLVQPFDDGKVGFGNRGDGGGSFERRL